MKNFGRATNQAGRNPFHPHPIRGEVWDAVERVPTEGEWRRTTPFVRRQFLRSYADAKICTVIVNFRVAGLGG